MHARWRSLTAAVLLTLSAPALAETTKLRITRPLDLSMLPLLVMEHEHLIERVAEAMNLGTVTVAWNTAAKPDAPAELISGQADFVTVDLASFLLAADASAGTATEIRGIGAVAQRPYVLVTRNDAVRTIRDFNNTDRIAVPDVKASGPAVMLEMAAAQEWGAEHYNKLDSLLVARPDEPAALALLSGKGDIDAHFSRTPYADGELADPKVHRVMDSFDIAGPHSSGVLATTSQFRAANPTMSAAILSALEQADDFIKKNLEDLTDMIGDPDLVYTAAPAGEMRVAEFMHRIGRLKHQPASWREWFLPEAKDLPGN
jgi:NitT/TauT family transport system substrate-binding protein